MSNPPVLPPLPPDNLPRIFTATPIHTKFVKLFGSLDSNIPIVFLWYENPFVLLNKINDLLIPITDFIFVTSKRQ